MKPGYKKTEIGVIPEDWEVGSLKQAFPRLDAGVSVNSDDSESSDYYILKTSAVRNGRVNIKEAKPVIRSDYSRLKCPVKKGSIIISRMNTPAMVGECGFSTIDAPNTFLPDRLWQIEPSFPDYDFQWLNYLLNTEKYGAAIRATATGTSNSMKNIAKDRLLEISIPKPSLSEQQSIAEALSDMDELIASLEKLIEKKKAIKQGAMQALLTGNRRLPGFSGEWEEKRLGDICKIVMGQSPDSKYYNYDRKGLPLIQGNADIDNRKTIIRSYTTQVTKKAYCGEIIFTVRAPVGNVARATFDCCLGRGVCALRDAPPLIYQSLIFLEPHWQEISSGSTFDSISTDTLENTIVFLPNDVQEGNCISSILEEMDKEIRDIEKKLGKSLLVKQGIIQQLLTGKIRLSQSL